MPTDSAAGRLGRAVLAGFSLACLLGGLYLLGVAAWGFAHPVDCTGLGPRECRLQRDAIHELSRYQSVTGGALALLGLALGSILRSRARER